MTKLAASRLPPAETKMEEQALMVEAIRLESDDVPVVITGCLGGHISKRGDINIQDLFHGYYLIL